jgi:MFS family permease
LGAHYRAFWVATAISNLGDGIRLTALPLLAATITRDPQLIAAVPLVIWLPWLIFGLPAGAIVDRVDRKALIRNVQLVRAVFMAGLTFLVFQGAASLPLIYLTAFVIGAGEVFADSATQTVVPALVPRERLEDGYGRMLAADMGGNELVGPPVGGLLFSLRRAVPFLCDAISYVVAAVLIHRLPDELLRRAERATTTVKADVIEGLRWLWANAIMRAITASVTALNFLNCIVYSIFVLFALEVLHVGAFGFGLIMSAGGLGGIIGTVLAGRLARQVGRSTVIIGTTIGIGVLDLLIGNASSATVAGVLQFFLLAMITLWTVVARTMRATLVPDRLLGRVTASGRLLGFGVLPLGAATGGWLADHYGLRTPFVVAGIATILVGLATMPFVTERGIRTAVTEADAAT